MTIAIAMEMAQSIVRATAICKDNCNGDDNSNGDNDDDCDDNFQGVRWLGKSRDYSNGNHDDLMETTIGIRIRIGIRNYF